MKDTVYKKQDSPKLLALKKSNHAKPKESEIKPAHITKSMWMKQEDPPKGVIEGHAYGINCVVIRYSVEEIGEGPNLHVHPYDEVFHILRGRAEFTVGNTKIIAEEGDVVIGPANIPHAYQNLGPGRLDTIDIHLNQEWIQYDLPRDGEKLSAQELR